MVVEFFSNTFIILLLVLFSSILGNAITRSIGFEKSNNNLFAYLMNLLFGLTLFIATYAVILTTFNSVFTPVLVFMLLILVKYFFIDKREATVCFKTNLIGSAYFILAFAVVCLYISGWHIVNVLPSVQFGDDEVFYSQLAESFNRTGIESVFVFYDEIVPDLNKYPNFYHFYDIWLLAIFQKISVFKVNLACTWWGVQPFYYSFIIISIMAILKEVTKDKLNHFILLGIAFLSFFYVPYVPILPIGINGYSGSSTSFHWKFVLSPFIFLIAWFRINGSLNSKISYFIYTISVLINPLYILICALIELIYLIVVKKNILNYIKELYFKVNLTAIFLFIATLCLLLFNALDRLGIEYMSSNSFDIQRYLEKFIYHSFRAYPTSFVYYWPIVIFVLAFRNLKKIDFILRTILILFVFFFVSLLLVGLFNFSRESFQIFGMFTPPLLSTLIGVSIVYVLTRVKSIKTLPVYFLIIFLSIISIRKNGYPEYEKYQKFYRNNIENINELSKSFNNLESKPFYYLGFVLDFNSIQSEFKLNALFASKNGELSAVLNNVVPICLNYNSYKTEDLILNSKNELKNHQRAAINRLPISKDGDLNRFIIDNDIKLYATYTKSEKFVDSLINKFNLNKSKAFNQSNKYFFMKDE